jgi:serine/threonine protein kinase
MNEIIGSLNNRYRILEKIGSGKFGQVFRGVNERTGEEIAIKKEDKSSPGKILKHETIILNYLYRNGCKKIPFIYWYGVVKSDYYLVMPLYTSIKKLNEEKSMTKMITILKNIHQNYVIHRDIKPQNFMEKNGEIYLIDFGLSTTFVDEDNNHIKNQGSREHIIGTPNYISINVHNGVEPSRRDDLISLAYVYLYFLNGCLPWERGQYSLSKSSNVYENTNILNEEIQIKKQMKIEYHTFSEKTAENDKTENLKLNQYFNYCNQLKYEETPDYNYLIKLYCQTSNI